MATVTDVMVSGCAKEKPGFGPKGHMCAYVRRMNVGCIATFGPLLSTTPHSRLPAAACGKSKSATSDSRCAMEVSPLPAVLLIGEALKVGIGQHRSLDLLFSYPPTGSLSCRGMKITRNDSRSTR